MTVDAIAHRRTDEHGTGMIGSASGAAVFLVFLLVAVQVSLHLFATSTVTAVGYDAARSVASAAVDHRDPAAVARAQDRASARLRRSLGRLGRRATLRWQVDASTVRLQVVVPTPGVLPSATVRRLGADAIDRTFTVRVERFR